MAVLDDHDFDGAVIRRLFAEITAMLEDAHDAAVEGQASSRDAAHYQQQAETLDRLLHDAMRLGRAITVIAARRV